MQGFDDLRKKHNQQTFRAPPDRVRMTGYGRVYPASARTEEQADPDLPVHLDGLPENLMRTLAFSGTPPEETKERLYHRYHQSVVQLQQHFDHCGRFATEVFKANVVQRPDWMQDREKFERVEAWMQKPQNGMPSWDFRMPEVLKIELHRKPAFLVRGTLEMSLRESCLTLSKRLAKALDYLMDLEQASLVEWECEDACRLHAFGNVLPNGKVGEAPPYRVVQEIVTARNFQIQAAAKLPRPRRVQELEKNLPRWCDPSARVVAGTECRRVVIRDGVAEAEPRFRQLAALVLGPYVLCQWDATELEEADRASLNGPPVALTEVVTATPTGKKPLLLRWMK